MDVQDPRLGVQYRDRDELAIKVFQLFKKLLETHEEGKYAEDALKLLSNERHTLFVDFKDVELYDNYLANTIVCEFYRVYPYLCRAVSTYVREERMRQAEAMMLPDTDVAQRSIAREQLKKELDKPAIRSKDYYLGFYNFAQRDNIRELSTSKVGMLTRVTGQVVRTHIVHPELQIGCFKCKDCLTEQFKHQQFRLTEPPHCINEQCANRTRWELVLDKCSFTDFQRLRIQEVQNELPRGCIPRSLDVIVRGADQVESIQPGDQCDFIGTLLAIPDVGQMMSGALGTATLDPANAGESGISGLKSTGVRELTHSLAFYATACLLEGASKPSINIDDNAREEAYAGRLGITDFSSDEINKIHQMSEDPNLLDNLSQSLFSSVFGSDDVKRGIVLQLLGGVPKHTPTGVKLRGDINICLVGDPSTAKSQFLKIVTGFAPLKTVYASGKGSSASGLTAAVVRDEAGGFVIEAGALMLADRGICCIDEFDKMDVKDQVAIHEAMEQQTISITKAGVSATLNSRCSILAAANPIGGNYDPNKTLKNNLGLSLPIMSRFDLFFTLVDPQSEENDRLISSRIIDMHLTFDDQTAAQANMVYSFEEIKLFLRFARKFYPKIPSELESVFENAYIRLRQNSKDNKMSMGVTVRQFESLVRLSEAIARAHCSEVVKQEYVALAERLIRGTIIQVGRVDVDLDSQPAEFTQDGQPCTQTSTQTSQSNQTKLSLPVEKYVKMARMLVAKLNQQAAREGDSLAIKRSELIDWYLHKCVGEIATESDLIKMKLLCERVIDNLIKRDQILLELHDDGRIVEANMAPTEDEDRMIMVNPNFDEDFSEITI